MSRRPYRLGFGPDLGGLVAAPRGHPSRFNAGPARQPHRTHNVLPICSLGLEGSWLMASNLLNSRTLSSGARLISFPCGEGLGVGVAVGGDISRNNNDPPP